MKETNHDYQNCLVGNAYESKCNGEYSSWCRFKENFLGFTDKSIQNYDDTYHFVFRYDIHKQQNELYKLELCILLQRKGIYLHIYVNNIPTETLDDEVEPWLKGRFEYLKSLWIEVAK